MKTPVRRRRSTEETAKKQIKPLKIRRTNSATTQLGLTVLLYPDKEEHLIGLNNYVGYRVCFRCHFSYLFTSTHFHAQIQVHDPVNFPEVNARGFAVGMNQEVFIAVDATISDR